MRNIASRYVHSGLSVIPIRADGSKAPAVGAWARYASSAPDAGTLADWFAPSNAVGIAIVCGRVSGNLAVIDIESDAAWKKWYGRVREELGADALDALPIVSTPKGGRHIYCRIEETWVAGGVLARDEKKRVLIEVRGQGHYVLAPGCPSACHPLNLPYSLMQGDICAFAPISSAMFASLCALARELTEYVPAENVYAAPTSSAATGTRPGSDYNRRAQWSDILTPHGWTVDRTSGETTYWVRPGKTAGVSATTGRCKSECGGDLLYVFSSNAHPFEADTAYDKFGAYARLEHAGEMANAAKQLAEEGFGELATRPTLLPLISGSTANVPPDPSFMAVSNTPPDGRIFWWMSELKAIEANEKWLWDGFISRGGITLLSALWKSGKSTLLAHLIRAFGGEEPQFLGRDIKPSRVLYISEEDATIWADRRDTLELGDHIGLITRPFQGRSTTAIWRDWLGSVLIACEEHQFDLVVLDTLSKMWPVRDENNAGQVEEALMPLWALCKSGAAVLIVHHTRKSEGGNFTSARGSGGLSAFCETLIDFGRDSDGSPGSTRRMLRSAGRYRETPANWQIELDRASGEYRYVGNGCDDEVAEIAAHDAAMEAAILAALPSSPDDAVSIRAIRRAVPAWVRKERQQAYMTELCTRRQAICVDGKYYRVSGVVPVDPP